MKSIVAGIATEHAENGQGPVVLMLHGWGDSLHSFDILTAKLSGYQVVRLDLPGFGQSELPRETWDVERYAKFVADFCQKQKIHPKYLIGHSLGGRISIKAVSSGILEPAKLVLIASAGVADRPTVHNVFFMGVAKVGKVILKPLPRSWYLNLRKELYRVTGGDYVSTGALRDTFIKVINEDLSDAAKNIHVPTLLIWGEDDLVTTPGEGKKLNQLIRGSEFRMFQGAGHFVHQQKATEVADAIKKFLI